METTILEEDIKVFYGTESSFPEGIKAAMKKIYASAPHGAKRSFYGISRPEGDGGIVYRAAAQELIEGEGRALNCDTLVLKKGNYITETITNFGNDPENIGHTFQHLLSQEGLDPKGYCVEWYQNETDVKCMVRLSGLEE